MAKYKNIAAIWVKKDKNGKDFLSFKASSDIKEGDSFLFFANNKGGVETRPDYQASIKLEEPEEDHQITEDIPF